MKNYQLEVIKVVPDIMTYHHPLLFIHGAAGGAWYFSHFQDYFKEKGYVTLALSLRGHGQSDGKEDIHHFRLSDYVDDVHKVIKTLDQKPILIGHSMGGAIVQAYLGLYQEHVEQAILLSSAKAGGIDGNSPLGLFFSDARSFLRMMRKKPGKDKMSLDDLLNETIFSNRFNHDTLLAIKQQLTAESNLVKKDLLRPYIKEGVHVHVPVHVIGSSGDHIIGLYELEETAKAFQTKPIILNHLCHFLTIDPDWNIVADEIDKLLSHI